LARGSVPEASLCVATGILWTLPTRSGTLSLSFDESSCPSTGEPMRIYLLVLALVSVAMSTTGAQPPARAEKAEPVNAVKGVELKLADLETFAVKTDKLLVNNFVLNQSEDGGFRLSALCRNRGNKSVQCTLMIVGFDDKKGILWTSKASTGVEPKGIQLFQDWAQLPEGTLQNTASLWVRLIEVSQ
jgi:hypothetical protein